MTHVIAGAGPAGLVAAIGLLLRGQAVRVFERASAATFVSDAGGAYELTARTLQLLEQLGARERVLANGTQLRRFRLCDRRGAPIQTLDFAAAGFTVFSITRAQLQRALLDRFESLGGSVTHEATPNAADGWLIGADGIHSAVRRAHFDPRPPVDLGLCAYWGRSGHAVEVGESFGFLAPGRSFVMAGTERGTLWTACVRGEDTDLAAVFADFPSRVTEHLGGVRSATRILEQHPLRSFTLGQTVLIGDAAHGMAPFLGLGANSAIEDAHMLASLLPDANAAAAFGRRRARKLNAAIAQSRRLGAMMHSSNRFLHAAFLLVTRCVPPWLVLRQIRSQHGWR